MKYILPTTHAPAHPRQPTGLESLPPPPLAAAEVHPYQTHHPPSSQPRPQPEVSRSHVVAATSAASATCRTWAPRLPPPPDRTDGLSQRAPGLRRAAEQMSHTSPSPAARSTQLPACCWWSRGWDASSVVVVCRGDVGDVGGFVRPVRAAKRGRARTHAARDGRVGAAWLAGGGGGWDVKCGCDGGMDGLMDGGV